MKFAQIISRLTDISIRDSIVAWWDDLTGRVAADESCKAMHRTVSDDEAYDSVASDSHFSEFCRRLSALLTSKPGHHPVEAATEVLKGHRELFCQGYPSHAPASPLCRLVEGESVYRYLTRREDRDTLTSHTADPMAPTFTADEIDKINTWCEQLTNDETTYRDRLDPNAQIQGRFAHVSFWTCEEEIDNLRSTTNTLRVCRFLGLATAYTSGIFLRIAADRAAPTTVPTCWDGWGQPYFKPARTLPDGSRPGFGRTWDQDQPADPDAGAREVVTRPPKVGATLKPRPLH